MKKRVMLVVSLTLLFASFVPIPALAIGVAMGPATIEIEDALRGGEYTRTLSVFNPSAPATDYTIRADGEVADWLSFFNWDTNEPVESFAIDGQSEVTILVKMDIPLDIPNGAYAATIYVETTPTEIDEEMGTSAVLQASTELTINISDTQTISGTVGSITGLDTEVGMPWRLEVAFMNTGNVSVNPKIDCQISQDGKSVDELSYDDTPVEPGSTETIKVEWDTTGQEIGDYLASVKVFLGDEMVGSGNTGFSLLPVGALTREGTLTEISIGGGRTVVGNLMTVLADFTNTGLIDTKAKFIGEVHLDGELIKVLESEELLVPVGENTILKTYLELGKAGEYEISGHVNYEGKKTEVKTFAFTATDKTVAAAFSDSDETPVSQPINMWALIVGGIVGVLILALIIILVVPWVKLQPARRVILAQWAKLKLVYKDLWPQYTVVKRSRRTATAQRAKAPSRKAVTRQRVSQEPVWRAVEVKWRRLFLTAKLSINGWLHK